MTLTEIDNDIMDQINAMRRQEDTGDYKHVNYFSLLKYVKDKYAIDQECRSKMVKWCYDVVNFYQFNREIVSITMSYLDRFLSTKAGSFVLRDRDRYQLATMASLFLAIKVFGYEKLEASFLCQVSRGLFSESDLYKMERLILSSLNWRMNPPTVSAFIELFLGLLAPKTFSRYSQRLLKKTIREFAHLQAEIAVIDYSLFKHRPSNIAVVSIINAIEGISTEILSVAAKHDFQNIIKRIAGIDLSNNELQEIRFLLLNQIRDSAKKPSDNARIEACTSHINKKQKATEVISSHCEDSRSVIV